ncbi:MAG: HNH endonuclease signature motif containing protein [Rhodospirillaceae bacterium]
MSEVVNISTICGLLGRGPVWRNGAGSSMRSRKHVIPNSIPLPQRRLLASPNDEIAPLSRFVLARLLTILVTATSIPLLILALTFSTAAVAGDLPDPRLTPGDVLSTATGEICHPGYSKKVRKVPEGLKRQVFAEYAISSNHEDACGVTAEGCEVDHLISLELGGSNDIKNLWPEPYGGSTWNAHVKDRLENELHRRVCAGMMAIEDAQAMIAKDWIAAYRQIFGTDEP